MPHQCETSKVYINAKGDEFLVVRMWDGGAGYFLKSSTGRRGYGKFWTLGGHGATRNDGEVYFTRTAMNGRNGLVERLTMKA